MSNEAITWAYRQHTGRGAGCKAVLLALADKADQDHSCYPSQRLLAEMTEQDLRSVRRHLAYLEDVLHLLHRQHRMRPDGSGQRTSDRYYLHVEQALPDTVSAGATGHPVQDHRTLCPLPPDTVSGQEPTVNPTEPSESARERATPPSKTPKKTKSAPRKAAAKAPPTGAGPLAEVHELMPKPRAARATQIPESWAPSRALVDWAKAELRMTTQDVKYEHEKFMDHHRSRGNRFVDIGGAWRNWMRKSREYAARGPAAEPEILIGSERRTIW